MDESVPWVLAIGIVSGGAFADKQWLKALRDLENQIAEIRDDYEPDVHLGVVFYVPGEVHRAKFSGMRTGRSADKGKSLMVQVSVPEGPPQNADLEVRGMLERAVELAEGFARRRGIEELPGVACSGKGVVVGG